MAKVNMAKAKEYKRSVLEERVLRLAKSKKDGVNVNRELTISQEFLSGEANIVEKYISSYLKTKDRDSLANLAEAIRCEDIMKYQVM